MSSTTNSSFINRPLQAVFDFATTHKHWPQYHPNSLGVSGVTERSVQVGDVTRERANLAGNVGEGDWLCVARLEPYQVVWTINNPGFKATLIYAFESEGEGTRFTRILAFHAPTMPEAARPQFAAYMQGESEKAVQNLKRIMENSQ